MELSSEDMLRLRVLVASAVAIRIDENKMIVYGMGQERELKVQLNTHGTNEQYLKLVREFICTAVFGSPRRYPKYIHRWAGMGQINNAAVDKLLLLGESEAMLAVAHATGLELEQARRAWWAYPSPQLARRLLVRQDIYNKSFAKELGGYLFEYLPFETESADILETVSAILKAGELSADKRLSIWKKGLRKKVFRIGFLKASPDDVPEIKAERSDLSDLTPGLSKLAASGNGLAQLLLHVLSSAGQGFVAAVMDCLGKCADQEEVCQLLDIIGTYFQFDVAEFLELTKPEEMLHHMEKLITAETQVREILQFFPQLMAELRAMLILGQVGNQMMNPYFSTSDAVGTVMRKQINPVTEFILDLCDALRSPVGAI